MKLLEKLSKNEMTTYPQFKLGDTAVNRAAEAFRNLAETVAEACKKLDKFFIAIGTNPNAQAWYYRKLGHPLGKNIRGRKKFFRRMVRKFKFNKR